MYHRVIAAQWLAIREKEGRDFRLLEVSACFFCLDKKNNYGTIYIKIVGILGKMRKEAVLQRGEKMKISTKGRYALRMMIDLAENENGEYIRLKDISERQEITLKYLEQIMPLLTKAGYVRSYRGNNGGYMLARRPEEYTAGEILRTAEGSLSPIPCLDDQPNRCPRSGECQTLDFWNGMYKVINEYADSVKLSNLMKRDYYAEGI